MTTLFPRTAYAEDMPPLSAYGVLTTHVLLRAFASGALVGTLAPLITSPVRSVLGRPNATSSLSTRMLAATSRGTWIGTAITGVGLLARVPVGELIQWQDRSWRLRENEGQVVQDYALLVGATVGGAYGAATRRAVSASAQTHILPGGAAGRAVAVGRWMRPLAFAGVGSYVGLIAAIVWEGSQRPRPVEGIQEEVVEAAKGVSAGTGIKA